MGSLVQDGGGAGGAAAPASTSDAASGMVNVVQRIIGQVFSAMGGSGGNDTIATFLETISDYHYTAGQDIVTDLLMCLARSLTFADLIGFLAGSNAVIAKVQSPLKEFLRERLGVSRESDVEDAVLRVLDETHAGLVSAVGAANVVDGLDYPETLNAFLKVRLVQLALFIWTSDERTFAREFYDVCQSFLADMTNLSVRCFSDGQTSLELLVRNQLSNVTDDVGSGSIGSWTVSTALGHLRNYVAGINHGAEAEDQPPASAMASLESYVVKTGEEAEAKKAARQKRLRDGRLSEQAAAATETEDETFETPRTSPEAMDVSQDDEPETAAAENASSMPMPEHADTTPPSADSAAVSEFPRELQLRSGSGPDMVIGREPWHRLVPEEWVPIITRDQGAHGGGDAVGQQAPFSDAYLTTQPAKKRRIAASRKPDGSVQDNMQRTLGDAIKVTGVRPKSTSGEVAQSALDNGQVQQSLAEGARTSIKRRLEQDKDFDPEKFPNCKEFIDRNK